MSSRTEPIAGCEELRPTRHSFLDRLCDGEGQASWREFGNTYWKFIDSAAFRSGLSDQKAEGVGQETVLPVGKKMPEFAYAPARCFFTGWLTHVTRPCIVDPLRRRQPAFQQAPSGDASSRRIATVERIPDAAVERVKPRVKPVHCQILYLSAVKGLKTDQVARMLQVNMGQVYLNRHRLAQDMRHEVERPKENPL